VLSVADSSRKDACDLLQAWKNTLAENLRSSAVFRRRNGFFLLKFLLNFSCKVIFWGGCCNIFVTCHHDSVTYHSAMNPADLFSHEPNPLRLAPGDVLFKAGDPGNAMFVLLDGSLDVLADNQLVEQASRGAIIGEMALIDQSPRSGTVVAREASTLAKLDTARFQRLIQQNPFFATQVMKVLVERIRRNDRLRAQSPND
jgi:hypothetical protein